MTEPAPDGGATGDAGAAARVDDQIGAANELPMSEAAIATTGASVLRGGLWSGLTTVLPQFYVVVQSAVAARYLGVTLMGQQSYVSFVQVSVISLFGFGLNGALVRFIGETLGRGEPGVARCLVRWVLQIELVTALLAGGLLAAISFADPGLRTVWLLAAAACVFGVLSSIPYAVLSGTQRWRGLSIASLTVNTLGTVATIVVLAAGGGIVGMFAVSAIVGAIALAWTGILGRRALPEADPAELASGPADIDAVRRPLLRFAAVVWFSFVLSLIVWRRSEFFFLKRYSTDAQIALYSIAFAAVTSLVAGFEAISLVLAPAVATLSGAGADDRIRTGYGRALRILLLATLPVTAGALAVGPATVKAIYGSSYAGTARPLLILLAACPLLPLMNLSSALLWGLGRARVWLTVCLVAGVANIALDFLFIPGHGAIGAAVANTGAQLVAALGIVGYSVREMGPMVWRASSMARAAVAAAACGVAAWLVLQAVGGPPGIALAVLSGIVTFVALGAALRILHPADAGWLDRAVGHHLGGLVGRTCRLLSTGRAAQSAA